MKAILLTVLVIFPALLFSQDLTGTWEGKGGGTTYIRMVIRQKGQVLTGYTYDEGQGYCKATFEGRYDPVRKRLTGRGVKMLEHTSNHVLVDYDLDYTRVGNTEYLKEKSQVGGFLEMLLGSAVSPLRLIKITSRVDSPMARKVISPKPPKISEKKKENLPATPPSTPANPVIPKPAEQVKLPVDTIVPVSKPPVITKRPALLDLKIQRASKLVRTITTSADTVHIAVYDNGEVDGDTVTVFVDNVVMLDRYRISDKPKFIDVPVKAGQTIIIDLFANNLGSIPPNTALLIFTAGKKRYELHASYDLETNARILIKGEK